MSRHPYFYKENYYAKVKKRLGEILVDSGVITEENAEKVLIIQKKQ